ncbi:MAG: hypothetical protein AABZ24_07715 [Nitrospirota bacterium]
MLARIIHDSSSRNPWRFSFGFSFDGADLYIGDVDQDAREEINVSQDPTPDAD